MSDDLFDFSTENVQRKVNQATKSIDELYSRIEKLNKSSLNHLETELDKLQRAMPSMELQVSTKYALDEVRRLRDMLASSADKGSKAFKKSWGDSFTALKANFENLVSAMKDGSLERSLNKIQFRQWSAQVAQATEEAKKLGYEFSGVASQVAKVNAVTKQLSLDKFKAQGVNLGIKPSQVSGAFLPYDAVKKYSKELVEADDKSRLLGNSMKGLSVHGNDLHSVARGLASAFNLLWLTWGNLAPLFAGAAVSFGLRKTFDIGSEVEYTIKMMETLGQTTENQGTVIREQLRAIDQTTMFSVKELGDAMVRLGQAGKSPAEAIAMLRPAADLAAVGMTDLKVSTDLLVQTQALFNKSAADSGKIAAQIFKVTTAGVLNVEDIAGSMKYASEANTRFGKSLEETLTLLGALAQAGLKGSSGGTALINFYRDLNGRSGPSVKALKELEKATKSQIKVFDEAGKQRSGIDIFTDIATAADKLKAKDADRLLAKIFSDRGGRTFFAMVRDGTIDLKKMVETLENVKPESLFDAAKGLMDTTKGAMDILSGALVGSLDQVFEAYSGDFKGFIKDITVIVSSDEFKVGVAGIVESVKSLYEIVKAFAPELGTFFAVWAGVKTLSIGVSIFQGIALAVAGLIPTMAMSTTALIGNTVAASTNGAALVSTAVANKALADGATRAEAATLGQAAATRALGLSVGTTGIALRGLAGVMAFLANPVVGLIATVATLGYTWYSMSTSASSAMSDSAKVVTENGKVIENQLLKEIALARQRNSLVAGDAFAEPEGKLKSLQATVQTDSARYERLVELSQTGDLNYRKRWSTEAAQLLSTIKTNEQLINQGYSQIEAGRLDRTKAEEAAALKQQAAAKRASDRALAEANAKPLADTAKGPKDFLKAVKLDNSNFIAELNKRFTDELALEKSSADATKAILDAKHSAGILSAGKYAAEVFSVTSEFERKQLDTIESYSTQQQQAYEARGAEISEAIQKAIKLNPNKISEATAPLLAAFENLNQDYVTKTQAFSSKAAEVTTEANKRTALSLIKLEGEYIKTRKESEKFWREQGRETKATESADALAQSFQFVNESIFSSDRARKAYAETEASESAKMVANLEEQKVKLQEATEASEAFQQALAESMSYGIEDLKGMEDHLQALIKLQNQAKANLKLSETTGAETVRTRAIMAEQRAINESRRALANDLASAVETGIFEGAEEGSKALRKVLQDELLRKPLRVMLQAAMNSALSSLGIGGGTSGSGAGSGFSGFSSGSGMATGFATSNIGQNLGLSYLEVDSLGNFTTALSDTGQTLVKGLDTAGDVLGYATAVFSAAEGKWGQAAGQALGTWFGGPVGAAIGGKIGEMVDQAFAGETRSGGRYETTAGKVNFLEGPSGGRIDAYAEEALNKATFNSINSFLKNLGSKDFLTTLVSGVETSDSGKGGAFAGGTLSSGKTFGDTTSATGYQYKEDLSAEQALNRYAEEMNKVTIAALQSATDIPEYIAKTVAELNVEKLSGEQADAIVKDVSDMFTAMKLANKYMRSFGDVLFDSSEQSANSLAALTAAFGGLEQFNTALETFSTLVSSPFELALASYTELTAAIDTLGVALPYSAEGIKQVVNGLDLTTAAGRETYATMVQAGSAMLESGEALLQSFGSSTEELASILVDGMRNSDPAGAGKYFADTVVYGIENALYQNMGSQITQIVTNGIIAPLMNSMVMGETAAVAISKLSIASITNQVREVTTFFSALFNNPEWIALMNSLNAGLSNIASGVVAEMPTPRFAAPVNPWEGADKTAKEAVDASDAAADALAKWKEITDTLVTESANLDIQKLRAMGNEEAALAKERELAVKGYDAYQIALYDSNQIRKEELRIIESLNTLEADRVSTEIALLKATGREEEALAKEREIGIKALKTLSEVAEYDNNQRLKEALRVQESLNTLYSEGASIQVETLRALGKEEQALTLERSAAIKGMSLMEVAQYDANARARELVKQINDLNSAFSSAWEKLASPLNKLDKGYADNLAVLSQYGLKLTEADVSKLTNSEILAFVGNVSQLGDVSGETRAKVINAAVAIAELNSQFQSVSKTLKDRSSSAQISNIALTQGQFAGLYAERVAELANLVEGLNKVQSEEITLLYKTVIAMEDANETLKQRNDLEETLLSLLGNTAELRRRELLTIADSNKVLQARIWDLEDARKSTDDAYAALEASMQAEQDSLNKTLDSAKVTYDNLKGIFDLLKAEVDSLYGSVTSTVELGLAQGLEFIDAALAEALSTGVLPEQEALTSALDKIKKGMEASNYSSAFEAERDRLVLAGKLNTLKGVSEKQLTEAEQLVKNSERSLDAYEAMLKQYREQIDIMRGINVSVTSVKDAVASLQLAISSEMSALRSAQSHFAPTASSSGGGGSATPVSVPGTSQWTSPSDSWNAGGLNLQTSTGFSIGFASGMSNAEIGAALQNNIAVARDLYESGWSQSAGAYGAAQEITAWAQANNIPGFDVGTNYVPKDMLALIHEGEEIVPKAYNPAAGYKGDSENLSAEVVAELRALREENRAQAGAIVRLQNEMVKLIKRWDGDGIPETRSTTA